jgi:hypothetical protein
LGRVHYLNNKTIVVLLCFLLALTSFSVGSSKGLTSKTITKNINPSQKKPTIELTTQNIIITPPRFYPYAKKLATFHTIAGLETDIINTTLIFESYSEQLNPPFKGYANKILPKLFIKNYNYSLAQRISAYLRDTSIHENLEYVTLFGDGTFIPPSYYIYAPGRMTKYFLRLIPIPDVYNNIIATDFFYTSPDYDLIPDYKVGRISMSNDLEANQIVDKIISWSTNENWDWFKNIQVAGDQPNLPEEMNLSGCYAGEMIAVDAINHNYFTGMDVTKHFYTEGTFTRESITNALQNGDMGFFYMMAHGFVDRWGTYNEPNPYIYADDLKAFSTNTHVPIVVSVACMCGAYDTDLAIPYTLKKGINSLGESVLLSPGAGIAYVGTTRATLGSPLLYLDQGKVVITKERGIAGMLTYFFEAYHNGTHILGDLTTAAITKYVEQNSFPTSPEKDEAFIVLMSFLLLGDPALTIPAYNPDHLASTPYQQPQIIPIDPEGYTSEEYSRPWYYTNTTISLIIETDSPEVNVKLIDIDQDSVVARGVYYPINESFVYTYVSDTATQYLLRAETLDGKEGWFYFTTIKQKKNIEIV